MPLIAINVKSGRLIFGAFSFVIFLDVFLELVELFFQGNWSGIHVFQHWPFLFNDWLIWFNFRLWIISFISKKIKQKAPTSFRRITPSFPPKAAKHFGDEKPQPPAAAASTSSPWPPASQQWWWWHGTFISRPAFYCLVLAKRSCPLLSEVVAIFITARALVQRRDLIVNVIFYFPQVTFHHHHLAAGWRVVDFPRCSNFDFPASEAGPHKKEEPSFLGPGLTRWMDLQFIDSTFFGGPRDLLGENFGGIGGAQAEEKVI